MIIHDPNKDRAEESDEEECTQYDSAWLESSRLMLRVCRFMCAGNQCDSRMFIGIMMWSSRWMGVGSVIFSIIRSYFLRFKNLSLGI